MVNTVNLSFAVVMILKSQRACKSFTKNENIVMIATETFNHTTPNNDHLPTATIILKSQFKTL